MSDEEYSGSRGLRIGTSPSDVYIHYSTQPSHATFLTRLYQKNVQLNETPLITHLHYLFNRREKCHVFTQKIDCFKGILRGHGLISC